MKKLLHHVGIFWAACFVVALSLMPSSTAYAATYREAIVSQQTTTVPRGQFVEDVVVLGHDVTVSGDVSEILVVIDGNIHLTSTSRSGIVVDLGGRIRQDPGARVNAVYHVSLMTPFWNGALFGGTFVLLLWAAMLALSIGLVILSVLVCFALRHQIHAPLHSIEQSVRRVGVTGVLTSVVVLAISTLLAVTILGLPLTGLFIILYAVAGVIGFSIVSLWIGKLAMRNSPMERPVWVLSLIGSGLMMAVTNIPFIGILLFAIFWFVGVGAVTSWSFNVWKARKKV